MSDASKRATIALQGVSEGPWEWRQHPPLVLEDEEIVGPSPDMACIVRLGGPHDNARDIEFVVASRQLVPELMADIETLEAEVAQLSALHMGTNDIRVQNTDTQTVFIVDNVAAAFVANTPSELYPTLWAVYLTCSRDGSVPDQTVLCFSRDIGLWIAERHARDFGDAR